jgi:hypothetical protein
MDGRALPGIKFQTHAENSTVSYDVVAELFETVEGRRVHKISKDLLHSEVTDKNSRSCL